MAYNNVKVKARQTTTQSSMTQQIGIVSEVPMDEWNAELTYEKLNLVTYRSSTFIAKRANKGVPPIDAVNWQDTWMQLQAGKGIVSSVAEYAISDTSATPPQDGWGKAIPSEIPAGQYLWTRVTITYTDNTQTVYYSMSIGGKVSKTSDLENDGDGSSPFATEADLSKYVPINGVVTVYGEKTFAGNGVTVAPTSSGLSTKYGPQTIFRSVSSGAKTFNVDLPDKGGTLALTSDVESAQETATAAVEAEASRAQAAEQKNTDAITAEVTRAKGAEKVNADAIAAEATRAKGEEQANKSAIDAEATRAQAAEKANADDIAANASAITAERTRAENAETALGTRVGTIEGKIPTQASATNQLADKAFVNSSINALAAFYITSNADGDAWANKAALTGATTFYSGGATRVPTTNDYAIVLADESQTKGADGTYPTTRYSYQGGTYPAGQWAFQYIVNNTSLTAAQVAALNSGITSAGVSQIGTNKADIAAIKAKDAEQDKALTDIDNRFATNESNIGAIHADAAQAQAAAEAAQAAADKAQETADGARAAADTAKEKADAAQATADGKQDPISVTTPLTKSGNTIGLTTTATPTSGSGTPITSGGVYTELGKKQDKLTAGTGITIEGTTISATGLEIPIDDKLDTSSANPVQNKVVATALDGKQNKIVSVENNHGLTLFEDKLYLFLNDDLYSSATASYAPMTSAVSKELNKKQDTLSVTSPLTKNGSTLGLTTTATPTSGSSTPITSGGVYTALAKKQDTINVSSPLTKSGSTLGLSTTSSATSGSSTPITSGGVHSAILAAFPVGSVYLSMKRQSPASIIGGTWQSIAGGKAFWTETLPNPTTPTYWITGSTTAPTPTQLPTLAAGLPNITGDIDTLTSGPTVNSTKSLIATDVGTNHFATNSNTNYYHYWKVAVDASKSSTIYGNSTTVQPPAYKVYAWYRTA